MRAFVVTDDELATMFTRLMPHLNERQRRIVAGSAPTAFWTVERLMPAASDTAAIPPRPNALAAEPATIRR